jgi:hypothetical protein
VLFPTTVTIRFIDRPGADLFRGRVESPNPHASRTGASACSGSRRDPDVAIDTDRFKDGFRRSTSRARPGSYYVKVPERTVGAETSLRGRSETIPVAGRSARATRGAAAITHAVARFRRRACGLGPLPAGAASRQSSQSTLSSRFSRTISSPLAGAANTSTGQTSASL